MPDVAIPKNVAVVRGFRPKSTSSLRSGATPVCALARNDPLFYRSFFYLYGLAQPGEPVGLAAGDEHLTVGDVI